jgi:hypothetical protein
MPLPLIPHSEIEPDCCGCICEVIDNDGPHFVCNECMAQIPKEEVARLVLQMESCDPTCPHCGKVNRIHGFSQVFAFRCRLCRASVVLDPEPCS